MFLRSEWLILFNVATFEAYFFHFFPCFSFLFFLVISFHVDGLQGKSADVLKMKHEKELKPVSLRVRDAAELLLTSLVEKVGNFPSPCGAHSTSCLLDEGSLLHQSPRGKESAHSSIDTAVKHFRYFAASEGSILLSVLEQPLGNDQGNSILNQ